MDGWILLLLLLLLYSVVDALFVPNSTKSMKKKYVGKSSITEEAKKVLAVYGAQNFITLFTAASHWTVYKAN